MNVVKMHAVTVLSTDESLHGLVCTRLKELVNNLAQEAGLKLVIDMDKTTYMDSAGCAALVASLKSLVKNDGDLKIARPRSQPLGLLRLTRLHKVFQIYDSVESAVESYT